MTSTLVGIDEDLFLANQELSSLQEKVIMAYEAQDVSTGRELEEALRTATLKRDALVDTKAYIVNKERLQDCSGKLSTVLYLSQMSDDFSVHEVAKIVAHANAKNELSGITGVLYVLRGWFASFLEGSADGIDRLIRKLKADSRHQRFRIVQRTTDVPNVTRRFPNNGLLLRRLETPQTASQQHPEATMLCELSTHLKLQSFVPLLSSVTRGRQAALQVDDPSLAARPQSLTRYIASMQPHRKGPFFSDALIKQPYEQAALVEAVYHKVRHVVEQSNNSLCKGALVSAGHTCDSMLWCFESDLAIEAVQRVTLLFRSLCDTPETQRYCPVIALHHAEIEFSMDAGVRATGPALRLLRQHVELAMQRSKGVVLSEAVYEALQDGDNYVSFITTEFSPRRPVDVFVPIALKSFSWEAELAKMKAAADAPHQDEPVSSIPRASFRQSKKPVHVPTSEEERQKPIPGFTNSEEMRRLFESLGVCDNGCVERSALDAWLHTQENAGVPVYNAEIDRILTQFADAPSAEYCTFDQFCMIAYQRLKG